MKKNIFYTIIEGNKLSSNFMEEIIDNIPDSAILEAEEEAIRFFKRLNKDENFRIIEVECIIREYEV